MKKNNEEAMEMQSGEDLAYTKVIGIDVANSTLKAYTDDASIVYRNTLKKINDAGVIFSFNTDYKMYVYNNEVYEVGDLSVMGSGGRGQQRYRSDDFQVESVIGLSKLLTPGKVEKIRVVTGVPSNYAKNTEVINKLKETLLGVHTVKEVTWAKVDEITFAKFSEKEVKEGVIFANANSENEFLPMPDKNIKADIIYICSPNNPTGAAYNKAQLKQWVDYALSMNAIILENQLYS